MLKESSTLYLFFDSFLEGCALFDKRAICSSLVGHPSFGSKYLAAGYSIARVLFSTFCKDVEFEYG